MSDDYHQIEHCEGRSPGDTWHNESCNDPTCIVQGSHFESDCHTAQDMLAFNVWMEYEFCIRSWIAVISTVFDETFGEKEYPPNTDYLNEITL